LGGFVIYRIDEHGHAVRVAEVPPSTRSSRSRWLTLIGLVVWLGSGLVIAWHADWSEEPIPVSPFIGLPLMGVFVSVIVAATISTNAESLSTWVRSRADSGEQWFELREGDEW
jgi:uncharacterized membrane protein